MFGIYKKKISITKNSIYGFKRIDSCENLEKYRLKICNSTSDYYFEEFRLKITIDKKNVTVVLVQEL
jgi:hypothetical protein